MELRLAVGRSSMVTTGNAHQLYGLRCIKCGGALELPHDPRLVHIDCPYCGQDNVLPHHLIEARQRQHALEVEQQARARASAEAARAKASHFKRRLVLFGAIGAFTTLLMGTCAVVGFKAQAEEKEQQRRAADPNVNGQAALLAALQKIRAEKGCDRILVQPRSHRNGVDSLSLDMIDGDHCVHVLGATGAGSPVTLKYTSTIALARPIPQASSFVDYRLCASQTGQHAFELSATDPFSAAAIECPRAREEGGSRSKKNDPLTTGKERVASYVSELVKAGCKTVIAEPAVARGPETFTLTSPANGSCFNMLLGSYFSDVRFEVSLTNPNGNAMPVPKPESKMRVLYCPVKAGKYTLTVTPSTGDHWAHASLDCPRFSAEGLRREKELKKLVHGG